MKNRSKNLEREVFRTRYSVFIFAIILIPFVRIILDSIQNPNFGTIIAALIFVFVFLIIFSIRYEIINDKLSFSTLFVFKTKIEISEIDEINRSYIFFIFKCSIPETTLRKNEKGKVSLLLFNFTP